MFPAYLFEVTSTLTNFCAREDLSSMDPTTFSLIITYLGTFFPHYAILSPWSMWQKFLLAIHQNLFSPSSWAYIQTTLPSLLCG